MKKIIDKLAQFVARNGPEFENMTKQKQKDNPQFGFLFGGLHYNYYQYRVTTEQISECISSLWCCPRGDMKAEICARNLVCAKCMLVDVENHITLPSCDYLLPQFCAGKLLLTAESWNYINIVVLNAFDCFDFYKIGLLPESHFSNFGSEFIFDMSRIISLNLRSGLGECSRCSIPIDA